VEVKVRTQMARLVVAVMAFLALCGCAARRQQRTFGATVEPSCLNKPIVLRDCDISGEPLKCRSVTISYRRGCVSIDVKGAK